MALDPYGYISNTCRRLGTNVFATRLTLRPAICLSGRRAAELFYDAERFQRSGAAPWRLQFSLFGRGGVQGLDGEEHRHRKQIFANLLADEHVAEIVAIFGKWWQHYAAAWPTLPQVVLYDECRRIVFRTACEWAGVPIQEDEFAARCDDVTALFQYAGTVGPKHWRARWGRRQADNWFEQVIEDIRLGRVKARPGSAVDVISTHRQLDGTLLDSRTAAVELNNVVRPMTAISIYMVLAAIALDEHPEYAERIRNGGSPFAEMFVQEVRRHYPFFPALLAKTRHEFEWDGYPFPGDTHVLLDIPGTNHDPETWDRPEEFWPERFEGRLVGPFDLIAQGGGDTRTGHRCPGEKTTIELTRAAVELLVRLRYTAEPDSGIRPTWVPPLPANGFAMTGVAIR